MGKLKIKNKLTFNVEYNVAESSIKYQANQTSDENEVKELYSHLQNVKYLLAQNNAIFCDFVYNDVQNVKVYRFSLISDSMKIYLMTKYYQIAIAQTDRVIDEYQKLSVENQKLFNKHYGIGEENQKMKQLIIDGWKNFIPSKLNTWLYSITFIGYSFFCGVFKNSKLEFTFMLIMTILIGFLAISIIYKRYKPIVNEETK